MGDRIQQFLLSITPLGASDRPGEDRFLVRTEAGPKGGQLGEEVVVWPLDHWINQAQLLSGDPLVALLNPPDAASQTPLAFGQLLYRAVFQGSMRESLLVAQGIAQNQKQLLQLRLGLKGDRLPRLPWELLSGDGRTLTTGTEVTFSRFRFRSGPRFNLRGNLDQLRFRQRLRILMVVSEPDDRDRLELTQEVDRLKDELAKLQDLEQPLDITIDVLPQPDRSTLTQTLEQGNYQIFHYAGHSSSGSDGGSLHLVSRSTGLAEKLSGQDLAGLLVNNGILLAFLNSCQGSYTAAGATPTSLLATNDQAVADNLAAALVEQGVPGVLAMSENIPNGVALNLMQLFYRNLRPDYPIDLSLSRVRQGLLSSYGSDRFYWALPILYLHEEFDGYLFRAPVSKLGDQSALLELEIADDDDDQLSADWEGASTPALPAQSPDRDHPISGPEIADPPGDRNSDGELVPPSLPPFNLRPSASGKSLFGAKAIQPSSPSPTPQTGSGSSPSNPGQGKSSLPWVVGGLAVAVLGAGGLWSQTQLSPRPSSPDPADPAALRPAPLPPPDVPANLREIDGPSLGALGTNYFKAGNRSAGLAVVKELLRSGRNDLATAAQVLLALPPNDLTAEEHFLRGRLAWQAQKAGQIELGSISDAIRAWESATAKDDQSVIYRTALGFAHYQDGDLAQAQQQWTQAVELAQADITLSAMPTQPETEAQWQRRRSELDARAGLALVSWEKSRQATSLAARAPHLKNVRQQLQRINEADALSFQVDELGKHWLWSQTPLFNWQQMTQEQAVRSSEDGG